MKKNLDYILPEGSYGPVTNEFLEIKKLVDLECDYNTEIICNALFDFILKPIETDNYIDDSVLKDVDMDAKEPNEINENPIRIKEIAVYTLMKFCIDRKIHDIISTILLKLNSYFSSIPKAKTAKIVKKFIDMLSNLPKGLELQRDICHQVIKWCEEEKRNFLLYRVKARLASIYHDLRQYTIALNIIQEILPPLKKLDDKLVLVELYYIECKVHFSLRNLPKAKASLTASRNNANAVCCPPLLLADIDMISGAIRCDDHDEKSGYAYFYDAFETYDIAGDPRAHLALKYMMLSHLIADRSTTVLKLLQQKPYIKYTGPSTECFRLIAESYGKRDLSLFEKTIQTYSEELISDVIINRHIQNLYHSLLEKNILKVIKSYSRVEVDHISKLMNMPKDVIHLKINEMILDKKLLGTLDEGNGVLNVYEEEESTSVYQDALSIFENLSSAVEILEKKTQSLSTI